MKIEKSEKLHASLKLILASSVVVFIGLLASKVLTYIYRIIIARFLGPEIYGLFSLALIIFSLFMMMGSLGLQEGLVRYISFYRGKNEVNKIRYLFHITLIIQSIAGIVFGVLLFSLANIISVQIFHNTELIPFLKVFSFLVPLSLLSGVYIFMLQAYEKIGWSSFLNNILQNSVKVLFLILFILFGLKSNAVMLSYAAGIIGMCIFSYIISKNILPTLYENYFLRKRVKITILKEVFKFSWPIIFLGAIYSLFNWTDSFVIGYFKDATAIGLYNAAFTIVGLFSIANQFFSQLFFPLIVKEYAKKNITLIKEMSQQVVKWIFIINVPFFLILMLFPGVIINLLFGKVYFGIENVLRILAIGVFIASPTMLLSHLLSMIGKSKLLLLNIVAMTLVNLILNVILIKSYGLQGIAIATAFSISGLCILLFIEVKHYLGFIPLRRKMGGIALISLIPAMLLILIRSIFPINQFTLGVSCVIFIALYLFLIWVTRCLDNNDLAILRAFKTKLYSWRRNNSRFLKSSENI